MFTKLSHRRMLNKAISFTKFACVGLFGAGMIIPNAFLSESGNEIIMGTGSAYTSLFITSGMSGILGFGREGRALGRAGFVIMMGQMYYLYINGFFEHK